MVGDTIRAVKEAEEKADRMLREAEEKGRLLVDDAKKEAAGQQNEASRAARQKFQDVEAKSQREGEAYLQMAMEGAKQDIAALESLASGKEKEAVELVISELV